MNEGPKIEGLTNTPKISSPETKKFLGHLIEGVKPIIACIGSFDDFEKLEVSPGCSHINNNFLLNGLKSIDWVQGTYGFKEGKDVLTAGPRTYIISAIDDSNKFSQEFAVCTGLIVAGIDEKTGKNISFVTHQLSCSVDFVADLEKRLLEMKQRCRHGTIDAVIVGGIFSGLDIEYLKTIRLLSTKTQQTFGFEPIVINGPKTSVRIKGVDDIYYDNKNRRLYFVRPGVNPDTKDFVPSQVDEERGKWGKKPSPDST